MGWRSVVEAAQNPEKGKQGQEVSPMTAQVSHFSLFPLFQENKNTGQASNDASLVSHFSLFPVIGEAENKPAPVSLPAELERLITLVARHYGCTPAEVEEIREAASRDIDGALTAYRAMAAEIEAEQDTGAAQARAAGMVLCRECSRLVAGQCMAAREGKIKGAASEYRPVQDVFRRCQEYHAKPYLNQSKVTDIALIVNHPESLMG